MDSIDYFIKFAGAHGAKMSADEGHDNPKNSVQLSGASLEAHLKSMIRTAAGVEKNSKLPFDWTGNAKNPPDLILKDHEAWEVKKLESSGSELQLNSSPPKQQLGCTDEMITKSCRAIRQGTWSTDLIYAVGACNDDELRSLFFCYGDVLCADQDVYRKTWQSVKGVILTSSDDHSETKELGRINDVDPLGRASLRIRGMWLLQSPFSAFATSLDADTSGRQYLLARLERFSSHQDVLQGVYPEITVQRLKVDDPDNPAQDIDVVLLSSKL
jgi:hypothetical protein